GAAANLPKLLEFLARSLADLARFPADFSLKLAVSVAAVRPCCDACEEVPAKEGWAAWTNRRTAPRGFTASIWPTRLTLTWGRAVSGLPGAKWKVTVSPRPCSGV